MHAKIARLIELEPADTPLISLYLDTRPGDSGMRQGHLSRPYQTWLKSRLKQMGRALDASERPAFERDVARIEDVLAHLPPQTQGVAIFACEGAEIFATFPGAEPFANQLAVGHLPVLYPLVRQLDHQQGCAVVLTDSERARIYCVRLGEIAQAAAIAHAKEHPEKPGHRALSAPRSGLSGPGYGAAQLKYQRYMRQQTHAHLEEVAHAVQEVVEREKLAYLLLAGDSRATAELELLLPEPLREKLIGSARMPLVASQAEILNETVRQLDEALTSARLRNAQALAREHRAGGLAVRGLEPTLEALSRGQIDQLVLLESFRASGRICRECQLPSVNGEAHDPAPSEPRCPHCHGELGPEMDLREAIARQVEKTGAHLEVLPEGPELAGHDGIGAWLRYA